MTRFSVILPTHNRPELFAHALTSVLAQEEADFEVIVVNDTSGPEFAAAYSAIQAAADSRVRFLALGGRPTGHGHGYSANHGVDHASGEYICFLDDDDFWVDARHLHRASKAIDLAGGLDLYMSDQMACFNGAQRPPPIWIEDLLFQVPDLPGPDQVGCYAVTPASLLRARGFCHLNTLIVKRSLYLQLNGIDENLRYECDRDFYLRAIDVAGTMRYAPFMVSRHNVPVPGAGANLTTRTRLYRKAFEPSKITRQDNAFSSAPRDSPLRASPPRLYPATTGRGTDGHA